MNRPDQDKRVMAAVTILRESSGDSWGGIDVPPSTQIYDALRDLGVSDGEIDDARTFAGWSERPGI